MRVAYIVSAYKLPDQLTRLLRRLDDGETTVVVHVDRKTSAATYRRMREGAATVSDARFVDRHVCHWGGFGHVRATLKGIDRLLEDGVAFDYVALLTGQDYPLRSSPSLARFFADAGGATYMRHFPLPQPAWDGRGGLDRFESWHLIGPRPLRLRIPRRRRIPGGLEPYGGSPYWFLPRPVVQYVKDYVDAHPEYVRFFERVLIPDEIFFQTLVMNSPYRDTVVDANLRYIDWSTDPGPAILGIGDLAKLTSSGMLFARKFDQTVDREILDRLDEHIDAELEASRA